MALFSSSTGRFGRIGQVDYAVANEVLNKLAHRKHAGGRGCRVACPELGAVGRRHGDAGTEKTLCREGVEIIDLRPAPTTCSRNWPRRRVGRWNWSSSAPGRKLQAKARPRLHANIYVSKAFDLELSVEQFPFLSRMSSTARRFCRWR